MSVNPSIRSTTMVVGILAALIGGAWASGGPLAWTKASSAVEVIHAHEIQGASSSFPVDAPPKGDNPGDYYVFNTLLKSDNGTRLGRADGQCTVVTFEHNHHRYQCLVIETLQGGTLIHDGIFEPNATNHFVILGGTGAYIGAGGEVTYRSPNIEFRVVR
ncbi:MAG: hypothetical protein M3Q31_01430 [Actinomycetota bacterium]|nr:hypothetical protein [Actinomycetota bacterium]